MMDDSNDSFATGDGRISLILMAAGLSSRMNQPKLMMDFKGKHLIDHCLALLTSSVLSDIFIRKTAVVSSDEIEKTCLLHGFHTIRNDHPEDGQGSSIILGVQDALQEPGAGYLFFSADQPFLTVDTILQIYDAFLHNGQKLKITIPRYAGKNGLPTLFPASFTSALLCLGPNLGGKSIYRDHPGDLLFVDFTDAIQGVDIDTPEEYRKYNRM